MNCPDILKLLHAYLDKELDLSTMLEVESHLEHCDSCRRELQALTAMGATIRREAHYFQASERLRQRIQAGINTTDRKKRWFHGVFVFPSSRPLLVSLATIALAVGLGSYLAQPSRSDRLTQEIVSSHVRSLMAEHLTDVASSDQHTVKPWFTGKLNYSPQVVDLTEHGFPLVGGRLDYLDAHPVTALVYRRRQHSINVFVWPSTPEDNAKETGRTINGYNLFSFSSGGMAYWVISDLNPNELKTLVELLRASG